MTLEGSGIGPFVSRALSPDPWRRPGDFIRPALVRKLGSGPSTELSEGGTSAGAGSTEEEGAASTELPSSSDPEGRAGEGQSAGEEEILEGEEGTAWVEDDGSSGFSGLACCSGDEFDTLGDWGGVEDTSDVEDTSPSWTMLSLSVRSSVLSSSVLDSTCEAKSGGALRAK